MSIAYSSTKFTVGLLTKFIKSDTRVHNLEAVRPGTAIVFVANHFTRLETILLPYELTKRTGMDVWSLAAGDLFKGKLASFLRALGTVSTKDPDRDTIIINSLLRGENPWIIFPEGGMIKDKKIVNEEGEFEIHHGGKRRPPFTGAAVLALQAELNRRWLRALKAKGDEAALAKAMERFGLDSLEGPLAKRTVIIPVNITYYPIRSRENPVLRWAQRLTDSLSPRAVEELEVEGSILSRETDIDIRLGEPVEIAPYIEGEEFERHLAACGEDFDAGDSDPCGKPLLASAAREIMLRYMEAIYGLTTVNFDHVFATLIRHQTARRFTERAYRNRIHLSIRRILRLKDVQVHSLMSKHYREVIYEDPNPKFDDFLNLCLKEKILEREGRWLIRREDTAGDATDFHSIRRHNLVNVIANEIEPLEPVVEIVKEAARTPRRKLSQEIREHFVRKDQALFEQDYAKFHREGVSKDPEVGRPFLLQPKRIRAGVVLVHGYLAAPLEIRNLAEYLNRQGFAVYGVRLRGHGTAPEDLAQTPWEEWLESVNRGYAAIKSLTNDIVLGGFSTGGCMALLAAGLKGDKPRAVFSINAPLHLRNFASHMIPTVNAVNNLLAKVNQRRPDWEFVKNRPENRHINYSSNPVAAVRQLNEAINAMEARLKDVRVPALVVQGLRDPIVDPVSGQLIFGQLGSEQKELCILDRDRHGIVNGPGAEHVFERVHQFLVWALRRKPDSSREEDASGEDNPEAMAD